MTSAFHTRTAIPHGGLDAAVGEEPSERDGVDALGDEDVLEVGVGEGVEALLALDDQVALLGGHGVADGCVPGPCQINGTIPNLRVLFCIVNCVNFSRFEV